MTDRGTTAVLLADFLAAVAAITFGLLYAKVQPTYLVLLLGITFALFFLVSRLLSGADSESRPKPRAAHWLAGALSVTRIDLPSTLDIRSELSKPSKGPMRSVCRRQQAES